jgi:hypothetical protein
MPTRRLSSSGSIAPVCAPSRYTSPDAGSMRRLRARSSMLFPAPEGPVTQTTSPSGTAALTPSRIPAPPETYRKSTVSILGRCLKPASSMPTG